MCPVPAGSNFWRQNMRQLHTLTAEYNEDFTVWLQMVVLRGMFLGQQNGPAVHESFRQVLMRCYQNQGAHGEYWDPQLH